jgi:membrane carboxypeptidase/penicillin-binding protein
MVGGRDYVESQFNRATQARRQPGSAFKPFVYAAALAPRRGDVPALTAAAIVDDSPLTRTVKGEPWNPRNYQDHYEGRVTVRRALEASLNAATVHVGETAGLDTVVATARALGIDSRLDPVPAMVLGSFEVTPLELARAYAPFANGGTRPRGPATVRAVHAPDGEVTGLEEAADRVLSPAEAYLVTSLLAGVVRSGTGAEARSLGANAPIAGKTGTTNEARDAWFVGYTPTLLAAVWIGFDSAEAHGLSGSDAALPIWIDFMRQALEAYPAPAFDVPAGIARVDVDATNGMRATRYCPVVAREIFLAGTEPPPCDEHAGGVGDQVRDWWLRFREWLRR